MTGLGFTSATINVLINLFLLKEYIRVKYPTEYENLCLKLVYYCIYAVSKVQHNVNKFILNPIMNFIAENTPKNNDDVEFILDGEVIGVTNKRRVILDLPGIFDFIIYTERGLKKIMDRVPVDADFICEEASIKFIMVEIQFGDVVRKIDFKPTKTDNFYVIGNIFHAKFLRYLLNKYYAVDVFPDEYKLKIIDHSADNVDLDETMYIKIDKESYSSIKRDLFTE